MESSEQLGPKGEYIRMHRMRLMKEDSYREDSAAVDKGEIGFLKIIAVIIAHSIVGRHIRTNKTTLNWKMI